MRVCDDRYSRERRGFELALRMLRHGARFQTVRSWTGLSNDRVRKLQRSYLPRGSSRATYRLRSKIPDHSVSFLKSSALGFEASTLSSLFYMLGLVRLGPNASTAAPTQELLKTAESFCEAYEIYRVLYPHA